MVHVALCMYGSIRTFTSPKLRDHYERFFVPSLANDSVDVYVVLIRDPVCSNPCSRSTPMSPCEDVNVEQMVRHLFRNFQIKHIEIRDKSDGIPTNQQLGGIDYVFRMARNNHDYDRYMRVRTDFFWTRGFKLLDHQENKIITATKSDCIGSDMFFILSRQMYQTWWVVDARSLLKQDLRLPLDSCLFNRARHLVFQHKDIPSALMRNEDKIVTWK